MLALANPTRNDVPPARRIADGSALAQARPTAATMPKRTDLQSILVLGSRPTVIGQAAEFAYSAREFAASESD